MDVSVSLEAGCQKRPWMYLRRFPEDMPQSVAIWQVLNSYVEKTVKAGAMKGDGKKQLIHRFNEGKTHRTPLLAGRRAGLPAGSTDYLRGLSVNY